jgi:hypothetical protein
MDARRQAQVRERAENRQLAVEGEPSVQFHGIAPPCSHTNCMARNHRATLSLHSKSGWQSFKKACGSIRDHPLR